MKPEIAALFKLRIHDDDLWRVVKIDREDNYIIIRRRDVQHKVSVGKDDDTSNYELGEIVWP